MVLYEQYACFSGGEGVEAVGGLVLLVGGVSLIWYGMLMRVPLLLIICVLLFVFTYYYYGAQLGRGGRLGGALLWIRYACRLLLGTFPLIVVYLFFVFIVSAQFVCWWCGRTCTREVNRCPLPKVQQVQQNDETKQKEQRILMRVAFAVGFLLEEEEEEEGCVCVYLFLASAVLSVFIRVLLQY